MNSRSWSNIWSKSLQRLIVTLVYNGHDKDGEDKANMNSNNCIW